MGKSIISEGRTTNEAIEKGLKELKVSRNNVEIKVLENEDKRSFFSILTPRVVKVEMTLKDNIENEINVKKAERKEKENKERKPKRIIELTQEEQDKAEENVKTFLEEMKAELPEDTTYNITKSKDGLNVELFSSNLGFLIGYRGDVLYSFQNILSSVAGKGVNERVRVILDIEGYKAKREKTLEELADKVAKTVIRTRKSVKLEPMQAYERKIIHSRLQNNPKVTTESIGEEPNRRIVISLK